MLIQKIHKKEIQNLLNRQKLAITDIYKSIPISLLISESGLILVKIILYY